MPMLERLFRDAALNSAISSLLFINTASSCSSFGVRSSPSPGGGGDGDGDGCGDGAGDIFRDDVNDGAIGEGVEDFVAKDTLGDEVGGFLSCAFCAF